MSARQDTTSPVYLTPKGAQELRDELAYLIDVKRPELAAMLRAAIQQGDLSENADYIHAKEEQGRIEGRIRELERLLAEAIIIEEPAEAQDEVRLGSRVTVVEEGFDDQETFQIVGSAEADPLNGKVSNVSPLGQALLGKRVGALVRVNTPAGPTVFRILKIE